MKISSISLAAAILPNTAWAQLQTAGRLRASRSLVEDLPTFEEDMSVAPTSLSVQFMGHGDEHGGGKSGKGTKQGAKSKKKASEKKGKAGKKGSPAPTPTDAPTPVDTPSVGAPGPDDDSYNDDGFNDDDFIGAPGPNICNDEYPTLDLSQAYQPLQEMPQIYPDEDGVTRVQLQFNLVHYHGASFSTILRLYNGIAPGPTLHVKPGGSMELELVNCMANTTQVFGHNQYQHPNSTNMHTHGPHISGELPGDDVTVKINPEESQDYFYEFNGNHMPGTFWYHPHMHGSTSLQTGQGASGMLIVDEPEDYDIPTVIKEMPEVQIVFQHMDLGLLRDTASISGDEVTNWIDHNFQITNTSTDLTNLMLVNMQFLPKITMEKDKWYRWRMMLSSVQSSVAFKSKSGNCEFKLLAKDGIFLSDAPRDVNTIMLSAGNRADVAVRCNEVGQEFMNTTDIPLFDAFGPFCPKPSGTPGPGNSNCGQYAQESEDPPVPDRVGTFADPKEQPTIMVIDVISNEGDPDEDLAPFAAPTPCYLVDLTGLDESEINGHFVNEYGCFNPGQDNITFGPPGWPAESTPLDTCGVFGPTGIGGACKGPGPRNCTREALQPFNDEIYINDFATGTVQEITFIDATFHPYHQHINSFQITEIIYEDPVVIEPDVAQWYKVGDWQDTLQFPAVARPGPVTGLMGPQAVDVKFRFQADLHNGRMIQHCHLLFHEDQGMMAQYDITGEEGVVWAGAKLINPMCVEAM